MEKLWASTAMAVVMSLGVSHAAFAEDGTDVDQVVVTAQRATTATKTDTALVETPQAISVVPADLFNDRGVVTFQEILRYSAGVTSESYGTDTRSDQPVSRGFVSTQYQDGMRKLVGFSLIPRAEVYTMERVELLRGPSSVLYGQGATGGVVNIVSKRPRFDAGGEVAVQYGSHDRKQVQFDITGAPGDSDVLAARLVGVVRDAGMQTDHVPDDRIVLAPSLLWKPSDRTSVTFLGLYQRDRTASSQQFLPVTASLLAAPGKRLSNSAFLGEPDFDRLATSQFTGALLVEHAFSDSLKLSSAVRYAKARTEFNEIYPDVYSSPDSPFIDPAQTMLNRSAYSVRTRTTTVTTDNNLLYKFDTGPVSHQLLVGIDYLNYQEVGLTGSGSVAPINAYNPVYGNYVAPALTPLAKLKQSQAGLYVQDQLRFADRVSVVLGARRDRAVSQSGDYKQTDYATSYRAGVIVDVGAGVSPYLSYSQSFQPLTGQDVYGAAFKPQKGKQWEGGVKWQPRGGTLVTLAVYDITETNRQTNDPNNVLNTVQTGEVTSKGVELEASHQVARDLTVTAAYSYSDAKITKSNYLPEVGAPLQDTPKQLASLWAAKTFRLADGLDLRIGGGVRYVGETISTGEPSGITSAPNANGAGTLKTPSYTLADALVAVDWKRWSLSVTATNLFDKTYYNACRVFGDCFTGNGRNVVGTLAYRF